MADKKITELNDATLPLDGTEQIPIVQGGETKKVSADELGGDDSLWETSTGANSLVPKNSSSVASGEGAIAEGQNTVAQGNHSTAMGLGSIALGDFSLAQGRSATAQGEGSVAQGEDTFATGKGSFASGIESNANGDSSSAIGDNVTANAFGETVVGAYNEVDTTFNPTVSVPEDKAFSVGVGSFGAEANGIVVRKNGIVTANAMTQALFDADTSGKIVVTKEILENEQQKRIVQLNLPQVKILGFGNNFSITSFTASFPTYTTDSGDTDENLLPLNTPKAFRVPFNCVATNLFVKTIIPQNANYVFYKTDENQQNKVILFNQTISNGINNINNPSTTQINKGDLILIAIKANNTDERYANIFLTLEEI